MTETYTVYFYHGTKQEFEVPRKAKLQVLFDQCCTHLHIEEADYFSLYVHDSRGKVFWLNSDKSIRKQLTTVVRDNIHFGVKYYHMDPTQVYSEETRLYFVQQVIDDIRAKHFTLTEKDLNIITALYIQSELGDYEEGNNIPGYTKDFFLFDFQSPDCEDDIVAEHRNAAGKTPGQCENEILRMVMEQQMYGMHLNLGYLQVGKGQRSVKIGVHPHGITILDDESAKVYDLPWAIVTKLESKRRKFIVRVQGTLVDQSKKEEEQSVEKKEEEVIEKKEGEANPEETVLSEEAPATTETGEDQPEAKLSVEEALENPPPVEPVEPEVTPNPEASPEVDPTTPEIAPAPDQPSEEPTPKPKPAVKSKRKEPVTVLKFIISERPYAKDLWRLAAEHHYFFNRVPARPPRFSFVRIGSRFRYSGRTFRQTQKDFSERKFDPIDPDVRVRMSHRRKRQSSQTDETEDSAYPGYVKTKESFRRKQQDVDADPDPPAEKPESNEILVENNPVDIPEPGTDEAILQKDVTDKFLEGEFKKEAGKQEDELPAPPEQNEITPVYEGNGDMADYPPPPGDEMVSGDTKVVEPVNESDENATVSHEQ